MRTLVLVLVLAAIGNAQDGTLLFKVRCASCHRTGSPSKAPSFEVLHRMSEHEILDALENGRMKFQGSQLTMAERAAIAQYLGQTDVPAERMSGRCDSQLISARHQSSGDPAWSRWGVDFDNSRFQREETAGIRADQVPRLKLKWAFGFPRVSTVFAQPSVGFGRLFIGSAEGTVYSLDARTGCIWWTYKADGPVRTAVTIDPVRRVVFFGDFEANVYSLDANTGKLL